MSKYIDPPLIFLWGHFKKFSRKIFAILKINLYYLLMYILTDIMRIRISENRLRNIIREAIEEAWSGIDDVVGDDDLQREALRKGFKYVAYHNTNRKDLTFFNVRSSGIHFGSRAAANERGENRGDDETWTNEYFLKIDNPYIIERDFDWEGQSLMVGGIEMGLSEEEYEEWREEFDPSYYLEHNGFNAWGKDDGGNEYYRNIEEMLSDKGYDCIIYKNQMEDKGNYSVAMFNPNNIKLACITHDDNGNEIPLEKRFDTSTDDVRY